MRYGRYMEFARSNTVVSLYIYNDHIDIHGFGTVDTVRPTGGVTLARIEEAVQVMRTQGFRMVCDVPGRAVRSAAREVMMAR